MRRGVATVEYPNDLEIVVKRDFEAPIQLVFDVFWKEEHLRATIAPFGETVTVCTVDLKVGGDYRYVFVTDDGTECSFRGTFLEVAEPKRTVQSWLFDGWPDAPAVETMDFEETDGVTTLRYSLVFRDQAGRANYHKTDGIEANLDNVEDYLATLLSHS
jgi:uncharacterized protein YndB with AHSA1/START domain